GSASVHADVAALALLPDAAEPFPLVSATIDLNWSDIIQPQNVTISYGVGSDLISLMKSRIGDLVSLLTTLRDASALLSGTAPGLTGGLDDVLRLIQKFDENVVEPLSDASTGETNVATIQDVIASTSQRLNEELESFGFDLHDHVLSYTLPLDFSALAGVGGFEGLDEHLSGLSVKVALDLGKLFGSGGGSFSLSRSLSIEVLGDVSGINLFDLFSGGAGFSAGRTLVDVDVDGNGYNVLAGSDLAGATLLRFGLNLDEAAPTDPETRFLQIGTDTVGLRLEDGQVGVAVLSPADSADARRWTAVKAVGLSGRLNLAPVVSATVSSADISINQASGASALNWTTAFDFNGDGTFNDAVLIDTGPTTSLTLGFTTQLTDVSGDLTSLNFASGLVTGSAHFAIRKTLVGVHVGPADLTNAVLLTLGLSNLDLHVGTGAVNFEIHGGSLAIASLTAPPATSPATDSRSWLAVNADLSSITFNGIPGLTLDVSALHVALNTADGTFNDGTAHDAEALDWTQSLNLNGNTTFGEPVASDSDRGDQLDVGGTLINFTGALVEVSGTARINVFDLVTGEITLSYRQQTVNVDADGDSVFDPSVGLPGTPTRGPPDLDGATLTTLGLSID